MEYVAPAGMRLMLKAEGQSMVGYFCAMEEAEVKKAAAGKIRSHLKLEKTSRTLCLVRLSDTKFCASVILEVKGGIQGAKSPVATIVPRLARVPESAPRYKFWLKAHAIVVPTTVPLVT